jgi:hypothetical protein
MTLYHRSQKLVQYLVGQAEGMRLFGEQKRRWVNNIKEDFEAFSASLGTLYDCECIYVKNEVRCGAVG